MTHLKGLGLGCKTALQVKQLDKLNLDWFYTWGATPNLATEQPGFVPMAWDDKPSRLKALTKLAATKPPALLGFNEPDHEEQATMTTGDARRAWSHLEATGLRLGSPATVTHNAWWMQKFMKDAKSQGLRVDFAAMHCYQSPKVSNLLRKVTEIHERYGLPVWLTEYGVADWDATTKADNQHSREEVNDYMRGTVDGLRQLPFVERFAWKTRSINDPQMGTGALFDTAGNLTSTGRLYASL